MDLVRSYSHKIQHTTKYSIPIKDGTLKMADVKDGALKIADVQKLTERNLNNKVTKISTKLTKQSKPANQNK